MTITRIKRHSNKGKIAWTLIVLGVITATATYYYLYPEALPEWAAKTQMGREMQSTTVYRWQDANGAWHASDQPPPEGTDYRAEQYSRDANVLPLPPELQR